MTNTGHVCQPWAWQTPHTHNRKKDEDFPYDGSVLEASNYCRDFDGFRGRPYCYTTDPGVRWGYCTFDICNSKLFEHFCHIFIYLTHFRHVSLNVQIFEIAAYLSGYRHPLMKVQYPHYVPYLFPLNAFTASKGSYITSVRNFKLLACFCNCTGWFL